MLERTQIGNDIFVVYDTPVNNLDYDSVSIMMINSNKAKRTGLAPIAFDSRNRKLLFDVTGRITLCEYLRKNLSQEEFRTLILNLVNTIEGFDEYMIDVGKVLLDLNAVYINLLDGSLSFICVAMNNFTQNNTLYSFFKGIVNNCYVDVNVNGINYFDCVRNVLRNENGFSLNNVKTSMRVQQSKPSTPDAVTGSATSVPSTPVIEEPKREIPREVTVDNTPKYETPIPTIPEPAAKEKKGLFGGLFSSSKKKKSEDQQGGFQGGVAGLKNGGRNAASPAPAPTPSASQQSKIAAPHVASQPAPAIHPQQQPAFSGTTVLNGGKSVQQSSAVQTPAYERPGTTVLKKTDGNPTLQSVPTPSARPASPDTTVLNPQSGYGPATTVLNRNMQSQCFLIRVKTHQRLQLTKPVIHIGRDLPELDFDLTGNTNVSHRHANVVQRENRYCIIDLESSNHTYLNGMLLDSGKEYPLSNEDKIRFADEEFEFMRI